MNPPIKNDRSRRWMTFGLCAFILFCATVVYLAGGMWLEVLYRLLTDGGLMLVWILAAAGIGSLVLQVVGISTPSKALTFATASALGLGIISIIVLLLGLCGWMTHGVAVGVIGIGLICGLIAVKISNFKFEIGEFKNEYWLWLIVVPIAAMVIVGALEPPGLLWGNEPNGYDVVEYHLQVPREWYELGRIVPLEHNVFSYFPFNVEMHYFLAMHLRGGPWAGMYLAQLMHVMFIALMVVALVGIAKPRAAMVAATVPWMAMLGAVAYDEGGLLLFGALAVGWMLRSDGKLKDAILAGAMAGFACGSKLTAVPLVLLAVPVVWIACSGLRAKIIKSAIAFVISGLVIFSPWMIRNNVWAGNPVFPEAMTLLGRSHFSETQVQRWQRAHSVKPQQADIVSRFVAAANQIGLQWRYGYSVLFLLALVAAAMNRSRQTAFLLALLLIQFIFWIAFTHLQGRFFVLAIPIAAMLLSQMDAKWWRCALLAGSIINACVAMIVLCPRVARFAVGIGHEDLQEILESGLSKDVAAALGSEKPIALAGDAKAFFYQIPMRRLTYRTVFDVDNAPNQSIVDAWIKTAPRGATILINPGELERFSKTYWDIPPMIDPANDASLNGRTWLMAN